MAARFCLPAVAFAAALALAVPASAAPPGGRPAPAADPPYGWWEPVSPGQAGGQGVRGPADAGPPGRRAVPVGQGEAVQSGQAGEGAGLRPPSIPEGHGFARRGGPYRRLRLRVRGAGQPAAPPDVRYRLTRRDRGRHGGRPASASFHAAGAELVGGAWETSIYVPFYASAELWSRFELDGGPAYAQISWLHSIPDAASEGLPPPPESAPPPSGWPAFRFPESEYNSMPFRGLRTDETVPFAIVRDGAPAPGGTGFAVDAAGTGRPAGAMARDPACGAWTLTALDDPSLPISRNPVGPPADTKIAVAVARIPGRGGSGRSTLSFSFTVARNRWSYRRLHPGVAALFLGGAGVGVAATLARRRFRFNVEL